MELFLNILKLLGIVAAGVMGIIGTLKETKDKKGRLTKFGKYIALLTFLGLVIAVASEFCDEYMQNQKDQNATAREQAATNQISELSSKLQNANDKLSASAIHIERLETRFERVDVNLAFDVTPLDLTITNLIYSEVSNFTQPVQNPNTPDDANTYSANYVGYINVSDKASPRQSSQFQISAGGGDTLVDIPVKGQNSTNWIKIGVSQAQADELWSLVSNPNLMIHFQGSNETLTSTNYTLGDQFGLGNTPDAPTDNTLVSRPEKITYNLARNTFQVLWNFSYTNAAIPEKGFASLTDLPHDTIMLQLCMLPRDAIQRLNLTGIHLTMGSFSWEINGRQASVSRDNMFSGIDIKLKSPLAHLHDSGF